MFALVDCNNFYVSCERVFDPTLNGKPVVVLSNNDGCAISRSNEAKKLGIPMGAPAFKYEKVFRNNNVKIFSSNFPLYGDMSSRVMNILSSYTPNIEIYSIDEAFLEFKGFQEYDLEVYCKEIQKKVLKWTGIPISIGIAPTKNFIFPLETKYGLSFINNLKPVTYNLISNGKNTIGLIAQDVEKVDESSYFTGSFINDNNVEMKSVDYNNIVIPLIKAVQELSDEIEKLKKEIEELKN